MSLFPCLRFIVVLGGRSRKKSVYTILPGSEILNQIFVFKSNIGYAYSSDQNFSVAFRIIQRKRDNINNGLLGSILSSGSPLNSFPHICTWFIPFLPQSPPCYYLSMPNMTARQSFGTCCSCFCLKSPFLSIHMTNSFIRLFSVLVANVTLPKDLSSS